MLRRLSGAAPRKSVLSLRFLPEQWYYGWAIVAVSFLTVGATQGTRVAFGVLLVPLADALGWGRGLTAGAIALNAVLWALSAAPLGALLDRWGPRRVWTSAAVLAGLGLAIAAYTREPWQLYLGIGVLAGVGLTPLQVNSQSVIISNWFVRRRGLAVGIVASGTGLGTLVLALLTQTVISRFGWQAAFLVLAGLFLLMIAPLVALVQRHRPEDCGLQPDGVRTARAAATAGPSLRMALRHVRFWALAGCFGLGAVPMYLVLTHGVAYLVDVGFSPELAAAALGVSGMCTAGGMLLWGYLADRWGGEWTYTAGSLALVGSMGILFLVAPGQEALLYVFVPLFALGLASRQALQSFMAAAIAQGHSFGKIVGILAMQVGLGSAVGPALGGWSYDRTGGYHLAFALGIVCAVLAIGCAWVAAPRHGSLARDARLGEPALAGASAGK